MEKMTFKYGKYVYQYFLIYQERKSISLTIQPNLNLILKCPENYSEIQIEKFLKRKWLWIEKQKQFFKKFKIKSEKKDYLSGESFLYLGRQYKLVVKKAKKSAVSLAQGKLILYTKNSVRDAVINKKLLKEWYANGIKIVFKERFNLMIKKFQYDFVPDLITRKMSKRWGSYLLKKKIILNPLLIKASKDCIDYVIAHELCHMRYKNHDKNFFKLLCSVIPDWKELKEQLELRFL